MNLNGLHHITAVTRQAQANVDFYTGVLGLRLVKKTVNQDDVSAYHLFYGDEVGNAGTEVTFFDWPSASNRNGVGSISRVYLRVPSRDALEWWAQRLDDHAVSRGNIEPFHGHDLIRFADAEGQQLALVNDEGAPGGQPWLQSSVPVEYGIRGLYAAELTVRELAPTAFVLSELMDYSQVAQVQNETGETVTIFALGEGGAGNELYVVEQPQGISGFLGAGGVHHIAFRVADDEAQEAARRRLIEGGLQPTEQIDRFYFRSIYFRTPGGQLFEIATDGPGFATDEDPAHLGESLALPPFLEPHRAQIEAGLKPVQVRMTA